MWSWSRRSLRASPRARLLSGECRGRRLSVAGVGVLGLVLGGCYATPGLEPSADRLVRVEGVALETESVELHVARPVRPRPGLPLLLYATGDGGWRSADRQLFQAVADWGYPVAGFASPSYLRHFRDVRGLVTPAHVAEDYRRLVGTALRGLSLSVETPFVLIGFSRGADLAVVAATRPELQPRLAGVVAVALTDVEENVHRHRGGPAPGPRSALFEPFEELPSIGPTPVAVIQSTRDPYVPAAAARRLFGPDSETRRFFPVEARGHTFGGAREELLRRVRASLEWMVGRLRLRGQQGRGGRGMPSEDPGRDARSRRRRCGPATAGR